MARAVAEINLTAIKKNIEYIKQKSNAQILAVVKDDAYGHGLIPVAKAAVDSDATWLGTALLEEAIELRNNGIDAQVIAWLTPLGEDFKSALSLKIEIGVSSIELLDEVVSASEKVGVIPRIHLEIDPE